MAKMRGFFLTLEGTDGAGKSTHARLLFRWLKEKGKRVILTREPGGGPLAEKIRRLLLDPASEMEALTELMLYEAARSEHVEKIIKPALRSGTSVLCDRFTDATIAYQGYGRGLPVKTIRILNRIATKGLVPDVTVLLDLPADQGLKRTEERAPSQKADRLEKEGLGFQERVRRGYLFLAKKNRRRILRIPVRKTIAETQNLIRKNLQKRMKKA